jgi:light-regulated signal transduction histidine kinase (bacteriophytochrome)
MSIEQLTKSELIKEVRKLTQDIKILEAENKSLNDLTNKTAKAVVEATEETRVESENELKDLPYLAISILKKNANSHRVLQVRFDLDGNAKVDFSKDQVLKEGYRASYEAARLMETVVAIQEEPKITTPVNKVGVSE